MQRLLHLVRCRRNRDTGLCLVHISIVECNGELVRFPCRNPTVHCRIHSDRDGLCLSPGDLRHGGCVRRVSLRVVCRHAYAIFSIGRQTRDEERTSRRELSLRGSTEVAAG